VLSGQTRQCLRAKHRQIAVLLPLGRQTFLEVAHMLLQTADLGVPWIGDDAGLVELTTVGDRRAGRSFWEAFLEW
jgi:hypothetical protein